MSFNKPFHRNYRPIKTILNSGYSDWAYIIDRDYSNVPHHYTRAFLIIQEDLLKIFQFIEPCDTNALTHSFRIHELLIRICIEIEANFKAILNENVYNKPENKWNINTYKLINKTHHLDDYKIELPFWKGINNIRKPFYAWKSDDILEWYKAYNSSKHNRISNFEDANLHNLIDAFSALCILLSSQFRHVDFQPGPDNIEATGYNYFGGGFGIGGYLIVDYPENWTEDEMYEFDWDKLQNEKIKFQKINYDNL